jgi:hypothetical protein
MPVMGMNVIAVVRIFVRPAIRKLPMLQNIHLDRAHAAPIDTAHPQLSTNPQRSRRILQQIHRNAGTHQRAQQHIPGNPRKTFNFSDFHNPEPAKPQPNRILASS